MRVTLLIAAIATAAYAAPLDVTVLGKTESEIIGSLGELGDTVNGLLESDLVTTVEGAVPVTGTVNVLPTRKEKRSPVDITVLGVTEPEIIGSLGEVGDTVNELLDSDLVTTVEGAVPVTGTVNVLPTRKEKRTPVDITLLGKTEPEIIGSLGEVGDTVNELLDSDLVTTVEGAVPVTGTVNILPTKQ